MWALIAGWARNVNGTAITHTYGLGLSPKIMLGPETPKSS